MSFSSFHLPPVTDDFQTTLAYAIQGAQFAQAIGAGVVLFKASSRANYIRGAKPFLDALERQNIAVTPVLQNHSGAPITTLADFREVLGGINDPRMKTLLEVGHFQRAGVSWREGYDLLAGRIALLHINDINDQNESVPYGTGKVDFPSLFAELARAGYQGNIVVELELPNKENDSARTVRYLKESLHYLRQAGVKETP